MLFRASYAYGELPLLLVDDKELSRVASTAAVASTPGSWWHDTSTGSVYVHTQDGTSPNAHVVRAGSAERELDVSDRELSAMGLNVTDFIAPFSDWSEALSKLASKYYDGAATGYSQLVLNEPATFQGYSINRSAVAASATVADIEAWIDKAMQEDAWLILLMHNIGTTTGDYWWSSSNLDELAGWVSGQPIDVVTLRQGLERISSVPEPASATLFLWAIGVGVLARARQGRRARQTAA